MLPKEAMWLGPGARGLYATGFIPKGSFVANFGPLREVAGQQTPYTLHVRPGHRGGEGGAWARRTVRLAPVRGWEAAGHWGPLVNHSCCPQHRTCEFVVIDTDESAPIPTVWVRTTQDMDAGSELCVDYNDSRRHLVPKCLCCLCAGACATI